MIETRCGRCGGYGCGQIDDCVESKYRPPFGAYGYKQPTYGTIGSDNSYEQTVEMVKTFLPYVTDLFKAGARNRLPGDILNLTEARRHLSAQEGTEKLLTALDERIGEAIEALKKPEPEPAAEESQTACIYCGGAENVRDLPPNISSPLGIGVCIACFMDPTRTATARDAAGSPI